MNDPAIKAELQNNMKLAGSLGIMGTPSFVIDSNTQSKEHLYSIFIPGGVSEGVLQSAINDAAKHAH